MKLFCLMLAMFSSAAVLHSQTLFTYGNESVGKDEFLRAYNKNKPPVTDKEKALREYLDLYTKFKLKVKAAQELHLDTLPQLKYDLQSFRGQVEDSYLNDEKGVNALVNEAFDRSQKDLHVLHFSVGIDSKMKPEDTVKAHKAMNELYDEIREGKMDYDELVGDISAKYIKIKGTDLGFITVFSVPYNYENVIYSLKKGEVNKPYRSKNGLHVFRVIDERKSPGRWKIAQILVAFPPNDNTLNIKEYERKADSIYKRLQNGEDFATLAKQFSDDKLTYMAGGEMPEFGTGKFDMPFEQEVLKLNRDGQVSKPFLSAYGYHILKRISNIPTPVNRNDATYMYDLKQKVMQDERINGAKDRFLKDVIKLVGFKRNNTVPDADLLRYADSISANPSVEKALKLPLSNKIIYSFTRSSVKGSDWLNFVKDYKASPELYKGESNKELLDKYIGITAMEYYKKHLEEYNVDFRYQMKEFKEGNMLFEIMERNIWSSAANDSLGLLALYNQNKSKYLWAPSADILLFSCKDLNSAQQAIASLKSGKSIKKIIEESNMYVQADSGRYELSQISLPEGITAQPGLISSPTVNTTDGSASFVRIIRVYEGNQQRTFEEAKGLVINDYQTVLENRWIETLKKKYPVKVNEALFSTLLK